MSFSKKITYFLVHELNCSYRHAQEWIREGKVELDGMVIQQNCFLSKTSSVKVNGKVVREAKNLRYFLFYKPRGVECTLNPGIPDNLLEFIPENLKLHPAGRLDKESEGLLLLTNDGELTWKILHTGLEKEYAVIVDKPIDENFKRKMENGVEILGKTTKPCELLLTGEQSFQIILTQGLNRQIRRMCYRCGVEVRQLKRVRIDKFLLGNLKSGEIKEIQLH